MARVRRPTSSTVPSRACRMTTFAASQASRRDVSAETFQTNEAFFWAAVGYLLITITLTVIVRRLETKLAIRR